MIHSREPIRSPVHTFSGFNYFHIKRGAVYVVIASTDNVHAAMVFEFLYKLCECFETYFGTITEESLKANFVLVYEILDEVSTSI